MYRAKLVLIANGGLGQMGHFQVVSHWIRRLALNNLTDVIAEICCPQGTLLTNPAEELRPVIDSYRRLLERAGREIVTYNRLEKETETRLEENLIPEDVYLQQINGFFDSFLDNLSHPYVKAWT